MRLFNHRKVRCGCLRKGVKFAVLWTVVAIVAAPVIGKIIKEQGR